MEIKYAIAVAPVLTLLAACQAQNTYIPYELGKKQKMPGGSSPSFSGSRKIRLIAI